MANLPFFVMIGPSNMNGAGSVLSAYPGADLARVIGLPAFPSTTPALVTVPGIKLWQAKMPFATSDVRNITDVPTTTTVETDGAAFVASNQNQWVYIASNTTGQGQSRRISANPAAGNTLTVPTAWTGTLSGDGTLRLITGSRSVGALTVLSDNASAAGTTSTLTDVSRTEADDTWVNFTIRFTSGANNGLTRTITNFDAASDTFTFSPAVPAATANLDTYDILQSTKVVVKDTTSPAFTGSDVGRWVSVAGQFRKITAVTTILTTTAITLDNVLTVAQAANDPIYVLDGATVADTLANFTQGAAFRDLQFFIDTAPVFFTGYDYCNYTQNAPSGPYTTAATTLVNVVPELMTQLRYRFQDTIYGFEVGINSAQAASLYIGTSAQIAYFSWMHDVTHLDYHPSNTTGILSAVLAGITSAQGLAVAQGDTLDPQGIFFVGLLENDTLDDEKLANLGKNITLILKRLRTALGNQRIPCVITGCSPSSLDDADRVTANAQALQLKLDDPAIGFVDTPQAAFVKHSDQVHYLAPGTVAIAQAIVEEWDATRKRLNDAARLAAELPTLATLRTRVRRRYERSTVGNDASQGQIDQFINDSIRELYNVLGDEKAWFLRRVEQIDVQGGLYPNTITLPRTVKRLLRIEATSMPGRQLTWKGIAHTDEGRTQITLHEVTTGPFNLHFIALTKELVADSDIAIVPDEYTELVVMLACKRLTECAGNVAMMQYYAAETARLWQQVKRSCQLHDRMRQGQLEMIGTYDSWINGAWPGGDEWGL